MLPAVAQVERAKDVVATGKLTLLDRTICVV